MFTQFVGTDALMNFIGLIIVVLLGASALGMSNQKWVNKMIVTVFLLASLAFFVGSFLAFIGA